MCIDEPPPTRLSRGRGSGGHLASQPVKGVDRLLPHSGPTRPEIRLRWDSLVRFSPLVGPHLPLLRAAIERHQRALSLDTGQGYLLDNFRWLHARTSFAGPRLCYRALGEPKDFRL